MADRIKLYLDEDAQRTDLIQALRARQVDVESDMRNWLEYLSNWR